MKTGTNGTMDIALVMTEDTGCVVRETPGNGNCLFAATTHQLYEFEIGSILHDAMTTTIREMVVKFLQKNANMQEFKHLIETHIEEYYPNLRNKPYAQAANSFLKTLAEDGTWESAESIQAIARIFQWDIEIIHEYGHTVTIPCGLPPLKIIQLVYRGRPMSWNHYASLERIYKGDMTPLCTTTNCTGSHDMAKIRINNGQQECYAYKIDGDGNCLFAAMIHQLFQTRIGSITHTTLTYQLRKETVRYINDHIGDRRYGNLIDLRISHEMPTSVNAARTHDRRKMLGMLARPGVWRGTEIITAVADIFRCNIISYWEGGGISQIKAITPNVNRTISIVYRKGINAWNHYDSFAHFDREHGGEQELDGENIVTVTTIDSDDEYGNNTRMTLKTDMNSEVIIQERNEKSRKDEPEKEKLYETEILNLTMTTEQAEDSRMWATRF